MQVKLYKTKVEGIAIQYVVSLSSSKGTCYVGSIAWGNARVTLAIGSWVVGIETLSWQPPMGGRGERGFASPWFRANQSHVCSMGEIPKTNLLGKAGVSSPCRISCLIRPFAVFRWPPAFALAACCLCCKGGLPNGIGQLGEPDSSPLPAARTP